MENLNIDDLMRELYFKYLQEVNQYFKKANEMANDENRTKLIFSEHNTDLFAANDMRIKAKYLN